jgi:hypothetical protein
VAPGVEELRMRAATGAYRAFYLARRTSGILVFHAFTKKTQKTPRWRVHRGALLTSASRWPGVVNQTLAVKLTRLFRF